MVSWANVTLIVKWHLSHLAEVTGVLDRHSDHATASVAIGCNAASMLACDAV